MKKRILCLLVITLITLSSTALAAQNSGFHATDVGYDNQGRLVVEGVIYNVGTTTITQLTDFMLSVYDVNGNLVTEALFNDEGLQSVVLNPGEAHKWIFTIRDVQQADFSRYSVNYNFKNINLSNHNLGSGIKVFVNNQRLTFDVQPRIQDGRTLVPLRDIFEALGADVEYDAGRITAQKGNHNVTLHLNSRNATVNGRTIELDVPAQLVDQRTLVPLRFVTEALGGAVFWGDQDQIVSIVGE